LIPEYNLIDSKLWQEEKKEESNSKENIENEENKDIENKREKENCIPSFLSILINDDKISNNSSSILDDDLNKNKRQKKIYSFIANCQNEKIIIPFIIHEESSANQMKEYIFEILKQKNFNVFNKLKFEEMQIFYKSCIITGNRKLKSYDFDNKDINELIIFIYNKEISNYFTGNENENKNNNNNNEINHIENRNIKVLHKIKDNNLIKKKENEKENEYLNIGNSTNNNDNNNDNYNIIKTTRNKSPKLITKKRKRLSTEESNNNDKDNNDNYNDNLNLHLNNNDREKDTNMNKKIKENKNMNKNYLNDLELLDGNNDKNIHIQGKSRFTSIKEESKENLYPIPSNKFEILNPKIFEIYRMNYNELKNVNNFAIKNEYSKIKYEAPLDLTGVNLNEIFLLEEKNVQIYPKGNMPKSGKGFNKPAIITIYKMFDFDEEDVEIFKKEIEMKKGVFLKYDSIKGYIKFKVKEWIK
jgi:hypothetical protein